MESKVENKVEMIAQFFKEVGIEFEVYESRKDLFDESFIHRSYLKDHKEHKHNERLEFLGDAVLELIITEFLYGKFPTKPEGKLTSYRSALVRKENLAKVARKINLGIFLKLSKGEEASGGRNKDFLLANLMEAFIGALYLSSGLDRTGIFVRKFIGGELKEIREEGSHIDPKSAFQEFTQGILGLTPIYKVLEESGKDHQKKFIMGAYLDGIEVSQGNGASKKEAQTHAAFEAMEVKDSWEGKFSKK